MPRPTPKTGSVAWKTTPHSLSEDAREELISFLGLDPSVNDNDAHKAEEAMSRVEHWLGSYPGELLAWQNAPKASDYQQVLPSINRTARKLNDNLEKLHDWIKSDLRKRGVSFSNFAQSLTNLIDAVHSALTARENEESRGNTKNMAMRKLVLELRKIFSDYHNDPNFKRSQMGAINPLSETEADEIEFITTAFRDAEIQVPSNIQRIFNDVEAMNPITLEEIYKRWGEKRDRARDTS